MKLQDKIARGVFAAGLGLFFSGWGRATYIANKLEPVHIPASIERVYYLKNKLSGMDGYKLALNQRDFEIYSVNAAEMRTLLSNPAIKEGMLGYESALISYNEKMNDKKSIVEMLAGFALALIGECAVTDETYRRNRQKDIANSPMGLFE